ncbi:MAG: Mrp/NBP35 family ATP-binding protein [Sphingomonadaceae bacterium]
MNDQQLQDSLPEGLAKRIQSLRQRETGITAIVDANGLSAEERIRFEADLDRQLQSLTGAEDIRIAMMADRPARQIIAVGSGKGGVGKSTLSANLAIALTQMGHKVGLVDADIYGPSLPKILGVEGQRPRAENDRLLPVSSEWGVPVLSMGQLVEPGKAIAWRGPMAGNALKQLIDAQWGDAEWIVVDLPPGTGDVQLTMLQSHKPAGAVIVSTPQDLALIDARRAMQLFEMGKVPILGLVENMAGYACPHCGEISDPFGKGGVEQAAHDLGLPFLGRIPLTVAIREGGDSGTPVAAGDSEQAEAFQHIASAMMLALTGKAH